MIRELIDTELETVAGGLFDVTSFAHSFNTVIASNSAPQFSQAFGGAGIGGNGGTATARKIGRASWRASQKLFGDARSFQKKRESPHSSRLLPSGGGGLFFRHNFFPLP